jgi:hypothetical protein
MLHVLSPQTYSYTVSIPFNSLLPTTGLPTAAWQFSSVLPNAAWQFSPVLRNRRVTIFFRAENRNVTFSRAAYRNVTSFSCRLPKRDLFLAPPTTVREFSSKPPTIAWPFFSFFQLRCGEWHIPGAESPWRLPGPRSPGNVELSSFTVWQIMFSLTYHSLIIYSLYNT